MIPFTPDERRAQFAPSQNVGGPVDPDILDIIGEPPQPTMAQQVEYEVPEVKPVDPDVLDIVNKSQGPMMASLMGASRVNPDQAAEAKRLGSQIGVGQDIALRNLEDVRKRAFMADVQRRDIARANPVLAGFLSDPTFANEASDDIEPLSKFERAMDYIANIGQAAIDIPGEFGAGFRTGQVLVEAGMLGSTAQLRGRATEDEIQKWNQYQAELQTLSGDVGFWRQTGETLGQLTRAGEEAVKGGVAGGVTGAGAALLAGQLGPQVFLPEEIVTVPAATLFGVGAGITSAFATTSARTMAGNNYMKNIQSGMDPDVARVTALGVGAIGGALELFGAKLVAAPFKGLWSKVVSDAANDALVQPTVAKAVANAGLQYSKAVGGEIGTEVSQQITEIAFDEIAGYASDPNFESRFATPEGRLGIREELKDIIVRTALGMSVLGGIGPGANLYVDTRRAGKAVRSQQAIQSVVEAVNAANLKRRDPDALEAFGNAALRETPAFIRGTTMRQILDANKVSNTELDAIVPGLSTKIQEAVDADNFVSLPLAQFGVRLAGTKVGDAMVPHLTVDPTAMTPAELEAFNANVQEFTALAAAEYEAKTEAESAFVQEADQVATTMRERLIAAGRDPALAEVESLVHQAFVVTQAARQGKTPAQFEAESGLREIVGAEMQAVAPMAPRMEIAPGVMAPARPAGMTNAEYERVILGEFEAPAIPPAEVSTIQTQTDAASTAIDQSDIPAKAKSGLGISVKQIGTALRQGNAVELANALWKLRERMSKLKTVPAELQELAAAIEERLAALGITIAVPQVGAEDRGGQEVERVSIMPNKDSAQVFDRIKTVMAPVVRRNGAVISRGQVVVEAGAEAFEAQRADALDVETQRVEAEINARMARIREAAAAPGVMAQAARINGNEVQKAIRKYAKAQIDEVELIDSIGAWGLITEAEVNALLERDRDFADAGVSTRGGTTAVPNFGSTPRRRQHPLLKLIREREQSRERKNVGDQASRIDADYMAAVERGDMETAQRMVDEAADASGYTVRAFHGTDAEPFTVFGNYDAYNFGDAAYFSPNEQYARIYAESHRTGRGQPRVLNVALRVENTFSPETNADHLKLYRKWTKEAKPLQRHSVFQVWGPIKEPYGENKVRNLVNWEDQWWLVEKIREAGFDSFTTSESDGETIAYGILNPNQIKLADPVTRDEAGNVVPLSRRFDITSPRIFEQAARGPARGGYDPSRLKILFGKGADFTTGAHELTHYYVDYYTKQALAGTAAPQMLADLDIMFKFMGVEGATPEERLAAFNAMPFETARPLIETITYNAEIYLFEGKAPSLELAGVFDRMLAFFRRAYKSIAEFVTQQRDIYRAEFGRELPELSDELRQVFDRMLADERQIKQAQAVAQMRGQFTVKPEGMDDAEWAAYQEMAGEATNAAIADMTKASLRQMEWLSRARSRIIKDMQARHTAQRKEVRERVQREVQQDPLYRAMAFLRRGQVVAPDGTVTEAEGVHRIDRVLAAEFAPTVDLARLGGRFGVLQDDGLHPDIVAEMFGFPAGASLLQALADARPMREVVEDRTDAEMLRLYGEMNTPAAREQEIQKALHNEARARLVGVELRFMGKIQQPVRVLLEAARQAAQQAIGRRRIVEIRPSEFVAAEAKASREVTAAMQENKPDVAVRAKRAQLLNNQLAKAALEARDEIDNGVRYLRRVLRDSNRQRMGADVADQIASLLDRFNVAPMTADEARRVGTLAEFLATLEDRGLVPDIAEAIGMRDTRIPYKNMTVTEFRDLVDAVKQLEYIGKNERKILLAKEKAEFESVRDQIVASVIENAGDRKANARTATTNIGRAVTAMKGFAAAHLKAASIVRILDGGKDGGPLWNYLIRSANEAGDSETSMRAEATADLTKILEPVFRAGKLGGKGVFFPTINRAMNREARLVVALNMGNAGNMQRLLDGEGWSIEAVMPVLQSLTEDELNTVQQIWDYFEKYRPMIGQKERRLYGKEPAWVDPQPLVVRSADGKTITLRGGYYPIKYDPKASMRAETMSEAEEAKRDLAGAYTTATTRRSFTKARVRKVEGRPLLYTLAGMYGGINDVIHDLTWHEWLITANRLMRSNSFDDAVRNRYGPEYVAQLKNWIKDVAAGERGVQNEAEMALNFLRQGISSAGLGFNIVSAAMQITGFNQSIVRLGAGNIRAGVKWMGRGIAYTVTNPMLAMQEVNEKSEFMRNRSRTQFRELNEIRNMVQGQSVAMRRVQMGTYFLMMRMQRMVDVPTWHGAYEKAMHEGRDEETAIALADQAVIDSQGGGMVKDLARVERGGPAVKLFTVFYGYMNTVYNMAAVQTMTNKNKGRLAADYAMLFVVPVVLSYMLKQALIPRKGDDEEEWDMGKIGRELAAEQLSYLMGTMVIAREFGEVGKMIFGVEGPRMGYGGPAGLRAIGETYQFATQASQGEFDRAFRKSAVNMIGAFTGLPSAQVNRTLDGLEALYEGETENVLAPLTGAKKR